MTANGKRFSFISLGLPGDTFGVVRFDGFEGVSKLYEFTIELVSSDPELDLNEVIQNPARLTLMRDGSDISFNGILSEFEQLHQVGDMYFYRAVLVPRIWWLSQTHFNQVFLDRSIPDILEQVLRSGELLDGDFEIRLQNEKDYPQQEYVCQFGESNLAFMQRLMEREGIYYFFEQTTSGEKLIITDTRIAHIAMDQGDTVTYSPPTGLADRELGEVIRNFSCRQKMIPRSVLLRNHNFGQPDMNMEGTDDVFEEGRGEMYFYGDHFDKPEEGGRLAGIRAEEFLCWKEVFYGDSTVPFLRPGFNFTLRNHFRDTFNQEYLAVEVSHQGSQASFMLAGLPGGLPEREEQPGYWNSVTAIPASVQFRPRRETEKPRFYGSLHARIDAAEDGDYAELDEEGRYKVILPFDRADRDGGKASAWIRIMQPYAGTDHGMHFPLHKGTEVLLTFINGDPDLPVIAGAVSSPRDHSVTTSENRTQCNIVTGGGNEMCFEDKKDHERILLKSPREETLIKLGSPVDDNGFFTRMGFDLGGIIGAALSWKTAAIKAGLELAGLVFGHDVGTDEGIEMRTGNGLRIAARKKEQSIGGNTDPGYSETGIVGLSTFSVKGYSSKSVTGWCDESTMGNHTFTAVGTYESTKPGVSTELESVKTNMKGKYDKFVGYGKKAYGKAASFAGSVTRMFGKSEKLVGDESNLKGSEKSMHGSKDSLAGKLSRLIGKSSKVSGDDMEMNGTEMEVIGSSNSMCGSSTSMNGDETSLSGSSTSLDGTRTGLSSSNNELAGIKNIM